MTTTTTPQALINRTVAPTIQPVSVADAKKQCEIAQSVTHHDDDLTAAIEAAREQFERDTPIITAPQTFELILPAFPAARHIHLQVRPVTSITSIMYRDGSAAAVALDANTYRIDNRKRCVILNYGESWPTVPNQAEAVVVTFVAGYASASAVPRLIKRAILLQVAKWFMHRGDESKMPAHDTAYERIIRRLSRRTYP